MSFHFSSTLRSAGSTFQFVSQPLLQRKCACGGTPGPTGECNECRRKRLARRAAGRSAPAIVHEVLGSPGHPLDRATRDQMEDRFGHDFSRVRVHADAKAGESARSVNARAYTVGSDVVFAPGQYAAQTTAGRKLLSHELTHVIQQGGRSVAPGAALTIAPASGILERQAEAASDSSRGQATGMGGFTPSMLATPSLQRAEGDTAPPAESENGCAGWLQDQESTIKRAAEVYVRSELQDDHGAVVTINNCSSEERTPGDFACTATFESGLRVRVVVKPHTIVVGVEPITAPRPDKPLCFYDFKCPEPSRDLVLTKRKCVTKSGRTQP